MTCVCSEFAFLIGIISWSRMNKLRQSNETILVQDLFGSFVEIRGDFGPSDNIISEIKCGHVVERNGPEQVNTIYSCS